MVFSPLLGYGLEDLLQKLPKNCFALGIEIDKNLYDFSISQKESLFFDQKFTNDNFLYKFVSSEYELSELLNSTSFKLGKYRRCIPLNFCASVSLYEQQYKFLLSIADNALSTFWKNRTTLIKLGKLYSANFFKNLISVAKAKSFAKLVEHSVEKPILVCGTGPSLGDFLTELSESKLAMLQNNYFIMAVDASLPVLKCFNIKPDCVIGVEGQLAIEKVYIGSAKSKIPMIADFCSRPTIKRHLSSVQANFFSEFTSGNFIERFKEIAKILDCPIIPPLGSVGLACVELALHLRKNAVPIFVVGLDFSYTVGLTHSRGSAAHNNLLFSTNKLTPTENNVGSAFNKNNIKFVGKSKKTEITDVALDGYAKMFCARYKNVPNLFDLANSGIDKGLQQTTDFWSYATFTNTNDNQKQEPNFFEICTDKTNIQKIKDFLQTENNVLIKIKKILQGECEPANLKELLEAREYLYLHFPDAAKGLDLSTHFLKRIRSELEYFIKITRTWF